MSGSSGGSTNTIQNADPWKGQQPYLLDTFNRAQILGNRGWNVGGPMQAPYATYGVPSGGIFGPAL